MDAKVVMCDFAEVSGGNCSFPAPAWRCSPRTPTVPYRVNITLAVLGLITPADTDVQHKMTIELVHVGTSMETRVMLTDESPRVATRPTGA